MGKMKSLQKLNGSTLKIIAGITMVIDHIGAVLIEPFITSGVSANHEVLSQGSLDLLLKWDEVLRMIGRTAFPLFSFLFVEGFFCTGNRWKYFRNLLFAAIISEVPFDLAICGNLSFSKQNVIVTLLIAFAAMFANEWWKEECRKRERNVPEYAGSIGFLITFGVGALLSWLLHTDYEIVGILLIGIFYLLREKRVIASIAGYITFCFEKWCFPAFLLIIFYNGKRGRQNKYFFYFLYPAQFLILYLMRIFFF